MKCLCCYTGSDEVEGFIFGDNEFFICNNCLEPVRKDAVEEAKASNGINTDIIA